MREYKGDIDSGVLTPEGDYLNARFDLKNHSPDGFAWGYMGSGPSQLSLALLCDVTKNDEFSITHYWDFKNEVISKLKEDEPWTLSEDFIRQWCKAR